VHRGIDQVSHVISMHKSEPVNSNIETPLLLVLVNEYQRQSAGVNAKLLHYRSRPLNHPPFLR
jgi:hypothetical protein